MNKKKVLFINNTSMLGAGTSKSLCLLVKYLQRDFEISVVSDKHYDELPTELSKISIKHYACHDRTIIFLPQLIFLILKNKIDIVYGNNYSGRSLIGFIASKITKRPFIWHIRESFHEKSNPKFLKKSNKVIANSTDTANRIIKFTEVKDPIIIPNGVEISDFSYNKKFCSIKLREELGCKPEDIIIINLGRICEQKNQIDVVNIAEKLLPDFPFVHFLFLGSFQEIDYYHRLSNKINGSKFVNNFHLIDYKKEFIPYLMGSDILLHTAKRESQGRVILEGMAAKLPIVAYNVGGISEVLINGKTGILRNLYDINGMADATKILINDQKLRNQFGYAGFVIVKENFSSVATALSLKKIIDSM